LLFDGRPLLLELSLLLGELFLLLVDLHLLFLDGVYEDDADAIVFDALDLAIQIKNEVRINFLYLLCPEAEVMSATLFPVECDRS
jgi:hypothetical protein